ncbi:MAG TPA: DivIVA domain-containing protein [Bdellovibrionota bacterium]|nr:DivIVA domain-containing protein [Bdellovibrionota bacterium]
MKLTPLDLVQQKFKKGVRGYEAKEVDAFLELVRTEWEALLRANQSQQDELDRRKKRLEEYQEKERTLQDTLVTAQRLTDGFKQSAKKEADILIGQAELQADKIIHQAHGRLTDIIDEINELKRQRALFESKLRGMLDGHLRLLELQDEARKSAQIEDVSVLPRRA